MFRPKLKMVVFHHTPFDPPSPEERLWLAVIKKAVKDLAIEEHKEEVRCWFESESEAPGSFVWICIHLGLSKSRIRDAARKILEGDKQLMREIGASKRRTSNREKLRKAA